MARNIEIKARVESVEALAERVAAIADEGPIVMFQDDTFFMCERGHMKLRAFSATEGQLIFYQRPNAKGPKESCYIISYRRAGFVAGSAVTCVWSSRESSKTTNSVRRWQDSCAPRPGRGSGSIR
jgi:hypothetical protein